MKTASLICIVIIFLISFLFIQCNFGKSKVKYKCENFEELYKLNQKSDTLKLFNFLTAFIIEDKNCFDALLSRGDLYYSIDNWELAKTDYLNSLKLNRNPLVLYQLGLVYEGENIFDSSLYFFNEALSLKKTGNIIIDHFAPSKKLSLSSDKYDIPSSEIVFQMGISYYLKNEYLNAFKSFDYCLNNKHKMGSCYLYQGAIFYELNKPDSACISFKLAEINNDERAYDYIKKYCK